MRITLVISSMGSGGAERVMATLANRWADYGHPVTLVTLSDRESDFFPLHRDIERVGLKLLSNSAGLRAALSANVGRIRSLRDALRTSDPDIVVSFTDSTNVLTLCAGVGLAVPIVVSERVDPTAAQPGNVWSSLRRMTYSRAAAIVVQTSRVASWATAQGWGERTVVVPNPIEPTFLSGHVDGPRQKVIVGVGRLARQKRFDRLVEAFDRVGARHPEWSLVIAGDGPERASLEARIAGCELGSRIRLLGPVVDVHSLLLGSEVFALSSDFEGFPNVLLEAMASGCAAVSTDCPSGPAEILRSGQNGLLTRCSTSSVADALSTLMTDTALRRRLGAAASRDAVRYSPEAVGRQWDALLDGILRPEAVRARSADSRHAA